MKDWEIRKVNNLYKEIDDLRGENSKLRARDLKLESLEQKVDQIVSLLSEKTKPAAKAKK